MYGKKESQCLIESIQLCLPDGAFGQSCSDMASTLGCPSREEMAPRTTEGTARRRCGAQRVGRL